MTRPQLNISDISEGAILIADDVFTCLPPNHKCRVMLDAYGTDRFYVECSEGKHFLDGQQHFDDPSIVVGFSMGLLSHPLCPIPMELGQ